MKKLLFLAFASVTFSTNVNSEWAGTPQVIDMIAESKTKISPFILDKKLFILDDFDKKEFVSKNNQNEKIYAYGITGLANILVEDNSNLLKAKMEMSKLEPDYLSAAKLLYNCCLKMKLYGEIFNYLKLFLNNVIDYSFISQYEEYAKYLEQAIIASRNLSVENIAYINNLSNNIEKCQKEVIQPNLKSIITSLKS